MYTYMVSLLQNSTSLTSESVLKKPCFHAGLIYLGLIDLELKNVGFQGRGKLEYPEKNPWSNNEFNHICHMAPG